MKDNSSSVPSAPRIEWVDYAKGICIFLVVMLHTSHHVEVQRPDTYNWLHHVVDFAKPFRMPDFFLLSGLFLANVIDRPWRRFLDTKVVHFYYFYVLWLVIIFTLFNVRYATDNNWAGFEALPMEFLNELVNPSYPLWFIHSLPIYFVITRLLVRVPWWIVFTAAAALQIRGLDGHGTVIEQFALRYVYFYTGYIMARQVFRVAEGAMDKPWAAVAYLVAWAALEQALVTAGIANAPGVGLVLGYLGALAVILMACLLCKVRWMYWLQYLGKNSIVVYLGFMIPMVVVSRIASIFVTDTGAAALLVTVGSVAGSVIMFWMARRVGANFLYARPEWAKLSGPARSTGPEGARA